MKFWSNEQVIRLSMSGVTLVGNLSVYVAQILKTAIHDKCPTTICDSIKIIQV